jgi:hypothetical protein
MLRRKAHNYANQVQLQLADGSWTKSVKVDTLSEASAEEVEVYKQTDWTPTGKNALIVASADGDLETIATLLEAGANIEARDKGSTALIWAAMGGWRHAETIRMLLMAGADIEAKSLPRRSASRTAKVEQTEATWAGRPSSPSSRPISGGTATAMYRRVGPKTRRSAPGSTYSRRTRRGWTTVSPARG